MTPRATADAHLAPRLRRGRVMAVALGVLLAGGAAVALWGTGGGDEAVELVHDPVARPTIPFAPPTLPLTLFQPSQPVVSQMGASVVASAPASAQVPVPVTAPGIQGQQQVVRHAEIRIALAAGTFQASFDRVAAVAEGNGGFVASSSAGGTGAARAGEVLLRVPEDRFETVRLALGTLGKVERQSMRGDDVSGQIVDFRARLRSLNAQEEALRTLLGRAETVSEVLQVQSTLSGVRQQVEQLQAQEQNLSRAVAMSSISVSLYEPGASGTAEREDWLSRRLEQAGAGALAMIGGAVVLVGWLGPPAALVLIIWAAFRLLRRRDVPASG